MTRALSRTFSRNPISPVKQTGLSQAFAITGSRWFRQLKSRRSPASMRDKRAVRFSVCAGLCVSVAYIISVVSVPLVSEANGREIHSCCLKHFDGAGHADAAAPAQSGQSQVFAPLFHGIEQRHDYSRSCGPHGVAQSNAGAVHVGDFPVQA